MHELPWITNFGHEWGDLPMIIIGKSPHEWLKKSLFTVTNVLSYFLHASLCPEHTIPLKAIIDRLFRHCR